MDEEKKDDIVMPEGKEPLSVVPPPTTNIAAERSGFEYRFHFSRANLLSMSFVVFSVVLMIPLVLNQETPGYYFAGGILGIVSSGIVLISHLRSGARKSSSMSLLFFRALCDMGIGFRFVMDEFFNQSLCHKSRCHISDDAVADDQVIYNNCAAPSGMIEFFELASEMWFFCVAFDLAVSITNPFSSFKARLKWYHVFSWSIGLIMAVILSTVGDVHGFWYVDDNVDTTAICWIKASYDGQINYRTWVFLYIPLIVVYIYCIRVLFGAYSHLRKGISKTFQHRVRVLVMNSINIGVYMTYWAVLLGFYSLTYIFAQRSTLVSRWFWRLVMFIISSKGFADLLVFILVSDTDISSKSGDFESFNVNSALRQEVLHYATTGIRECAARKTNTSAKRKLVLLMSQQSIPLQNILTLNHLLTLVFSGDERSNTIDSPRTQSVRPVSEVNPISASMIGIKDSEGDLENVMLDTVMHHVEDDRERTSDLGLHPSRKVKRRSTLTRRVASPEGYVVGVTEACIDPEASSPSSGVLDLESFEERPSKRKNPVATSQSVFSSLLEGFSSWNKPTPAASVAPPELGRPASPRQSDIRESEAARESDAHSVNIGYSWYWQYFEAMLSWPSLLASFFSLQNENDASVEFVEYEPFYFRQIRHIAGVNDEDYITSFKRTIKERLTEGGASGAFFFFTKDEKFIAKSCTLEEIAHIRRSSLMLATYFQENPESFITRIYGAYKLKIYGTSFYFFVTNNIFLNPNDEVINEKYDLKGSWVKRNSSPPQIGQKVTCTHCNQKYIFTRAKKHKKKSSSKRKLTSPSSASSALDEEDLLGSRCPVQVLGNHEPNVILKDNDLKHKIRLPGASARFLLKQLEKDTEILCSLGVMDYSLLVGVHNTDYVVDDVFEPGVGFKSNSTTSNGTESKVVKTRRRDSSFGGGGGGGVGVAGVTIDGTRFDELRGGPGLGLGGGGGSIPPMPVTSPTLSDEKNERSSSLDSDGVSDRSRFLSMRPISGQPRNGRLKVNRIVGPEAYYMGIVDFQQLYNLSKKAERFMKIHVKGNSPEGLSCMEPVAYRQRFLRRMEDLLDLEDSSAV